MNESSPRFRSGQLFAEDLRAIREERGVALKDIIDATRLAEDVIEQFERTALLDNPVFNRVYLRSLVSSYSRQIDIDENVALQGLEDTLRGEYEGALGKIYLGDIPREVDSSEEPEEDAADGTPEDGAPDDPAPDDRAPDDGPPEDPAPDDTAPDGDASDASDTSDAPAAAAAEEDEPPQSLTKPAESGGPKDASEPSAPSEPATSADTEHASDAEESSDQDQEASVEESGSDKADEPDPGDDSSASDDDEATSPGESDDPDESNDTESPSATPPPAQPSASELRKTTAATISQTSDSRKGLLLPDMRGLVAAIVAGVVLIALVWISVAWFLDAPEEAPPEPAVPAVDTTYVEPEPTPEPVSLPDSFNVRVIARDEPLDPIRSRVDNDLRRPYWVELGDTLMFRAANSVVLEREVDHALVIVENYVPPAGWLETDGTYSITRERTQSWLDSLVAAGIFPPLAPDSLEIPGLEELRSETDSQ